MHIIAGQFRRRSLTTPKGAQTRPSANRLRESLFNICQHKIEGARFLDLFAGSGAMGFEALSRGAKNAVFVENHKESIHCIEKNVEHLNVQKNTKILRGDVFAMLKRLEQQGDRFDIIFADPPYSTLSSPKSEEFYSAEILRWIDEHPLLGPEGLLFIEEEFHSQPQIEPLKTLHLKDSRRIGHAALQQYQTL